MKRLTNNLFGCRSLSGKLLINILKKLFYNTYLIKANRFDNTHIHVRGLSDLCLKKIFLENKQINSIINFIKIFFFN